MRYSDAIPYKGVTIKEYSGGYYGSQRLDCFPPHLISAAKNCSRYIDLTCGGAGFPYYLLRAYHIPLLLNDINYYAYINADATFRNNWVRCYAEDWFEIFCRVTHPSNLSSLSGSGYLSKNHGGPAQLRVNDDLARYIDNLVVTFEDQPLVLSSVGRSIMSSFTFRGVSWAKKDGDGKRQVDSYTPEDFWVIMCRTAYRTIHFAELLPHPNKFPRWVLNYNAKDYLQTKNPLLNEAFVYTDPAWPWKDSGGDNPYSFLYQISQILLQGSAQEPNYWTNKDIDIIDQVAEWMSLAFEGGAKFFCLSTQSTNYPPPQILYNELRERFDEVNVSYIDVESHSQKTIFQEWFGLYRGIK